MKTNNKGFLITGILYSLLLLFLVLIIGMIAILSAKQKKIDYITKDIMTKLNDKYDTNIAKTWSFDYTGNYQIFTVPADGYYKVELWGAQGGGTNGGKGAYTKGTIYLKKGENLYIHVGGQGTGGLATKSYEGGYNGGGSINSVISSENATKYGWYSYSGGGSTDIRFGENTLESRIMVAGAGGGMARQVYEGKDYGLATGGVGGAFYGGNGMGSYYPTDTYGIGGTQISAGHSIFEEGIESTKGGFGFGASIENVIVNGAGGSGYYGGGSAYEELNVYGLSSGGGGSSFVSGLYGCDAIASTSTYDNIIHTGQPNHYSGKVFYNGLMIAGDSPMPTHDGTSTMTGNEGNGYARISLLSKTPQSYTITNLIENGSFEDNLEGYEFVLDQNNSYIVENKASIGKKSIYINDTSTAAYWYVQTFDEIPDNHKIYYFMEVSETSDSFHLALMRNPSGSENAAIHYSLLKAKSTNSFIKNSGLYIYENIVVGVQFGSSISQEQSKGYIDNLLVVDLTETFGAGKEPTKEWCDENISYFDGEITIYK